MVPPHPKFLPTVQLKYKDWVVLNAGNFLHVLHVSLENINRSSVPLSIALCHNRLGMTGSSSMYQTRVGITSTDATPERTDEEHFVTPISLCASGTTTTTTTNVVRSSCVWEDESSVNLFPVNVGARDGDESSSSDTEMEAVTRIDRRVLTEADRDREWELLISNVPSRTSDNDVETDCASDLETCANNSPCASDSSVCTVKDISVRFDMLKHGDIKIDKFPIENTSTRNNSVSLSITTRSKSLQNLTTHQSMSNGSVQCDNYFYNDDSDDSTICVKQHGEFTSRERVVAESSSSGHKLAISKNVRTNLFLDTSACSQVTRITRSRSEDSQSELDENVTRLRSRTLPRYASDSPRGSRSPSNTAENEYDFIDEIVGSHHEKLSVFRKRRLADKKYEFSDENSENVPANYRSYRRQSSTLLSPTMSPRDALTSDAGGLIRSVYERLMSPHSSLASPSDMLRPIMASPNDFLRPMMGSPSDLLRPIIASPNDVLRPINQNISSPILSPRDDRWNFDWDKYEKVGVANQSKLVF